MATLEFAHVSRHFARGGIPVKALDDVSLRIEAGEMVAIVGASGSGKSTLMHILGCLDRPTRGTVRIDGIDIATLDPERLSALRRNVFGFVFQRYNLLPDLDARSNVELPARYAGMASWQRRHRADTLLERLGLGERATHHPHALSGGQQQRVSVARALVNDATVILADEPTGALDGRSAAELLSLLHDIHAQGRTVILVTHDPAVAACARRRIELRDGRVVSDQITGSAAATRAAALVRPPAPGRARPKAASSIATRLGRGGITRLREAAANAWTPLRTHPLRSLLCMIGICVGIAAVVMVLSLSGAARHAVESTLREQMAGRILVWRGNADKPPGRPPRRFALKELEALARLPGITSVDPERERMVRARHAGRDATANLHGMGPSALPSLGLRLVQGRPIAAIDVDTQAQVAVLDPVARDALFKPAENPIGATILAGSVPFRVIGLAMPKAGPSIDGGWNGRVLIPDTTFASKIDSRGLLDHFSVRLDTTLSLIPSDVQRHIVERLRLMHGRQDFTVYSLDDEFRNLARTTSILTMVLTGVAGVSLFVGGVGVMNIMLVSVAERTREIGIRKAVGARDADIRDQFLIEAIALCAGGGAAGLALSWLCLHLANALQSTVHLAIDVPALLGALAASCLVGLCSGTFPARHAASLDPVQALSRE